MEIMGSSMLDVTLGDSLEAGWKDLLDQWRGGSKTIVSRL